MSSETVDNGIFQNMDDSVRTRAVTERFRTTSWLSSNTKAPSSAFDPLVGSSEGERKGEALLRLTNVITCVTTRSRLWEWVLQVEPPGFVVCKREVFYVLDTLPVLPWWWGKLNEC
jgi:hypothetical protein